MTLPSIPALSGVSSGFVHRVLVSPDTASGISPRPRQRQARCQPCARGKMRDQVDRVKSEPGFVGFPEQVHPVGFRQSNPRPARGTVSKPRSVNLLVRQEPRQDLQCAGSGSI